MKSKKVIRLIDASGDIQEVEINTKSFGLFGFAGILMSIMGLKNLYVGLTEMSSYSIIDGASSLILGWALLRYLRIPGIFKIAKLCNRSKYRPVDEESYDFIKGYKAFIVLRDENHNDVNDKKYKK